MAARLQRTGSKTKYCEGWINALTPEQAQYKRKYGQLRDRDICFYENDFLSRNPCNLFCSDRECVSNKRADTEVHAKMQCHGNRSCQLFTFFHIQKRISLDNVISVSKDFKKSLNVLPTISIKFNSGNSSNNEVRIRTQSSEDLEKWYRFIYANAMFQLPQDTIELLPGQRHELLDMIENERKKYAEKEAPNKDYVQMNAVPLSRTVSGSDFPPSSFPPLPNTSTRRPSTSKLPPPLVSKPPSMQQVQSPTTRKSWYFDEVMSRDRAEEILSQNAEFGNLIMRKRTNDPKDRYDYAISVKLPQNRFMHYRVMKKTTPEGQDTFVIYLANKNPPPLHTVDEVVSYVIQECQGTITPLTDVKFPLPSNTYETTLPQVRRPGWSNSHSQVTPPVQSELDVNATYLNETHHQVDYHNLTNDLNSPTSPTQRGRYAGNHQPTLVRASTNPVLPPNTPRF